MSKIYIVGDINEESFQKFSEELTELENEDASTINIELLSAGGIAVDALAFAARMRMSPRNLTITAYGEVASAAVLILAYGAVRRMTKEAWVMVHEDSGKCNGDVSTVEKRAKHWRRMEDQWNLLLSQNTNADVETWAQLHKDETYLSAEECLNLGLIDEII